MLKLSNYYALRSLKCLHLAATVLWCGGSIAAMLLTYTVGLTSNIENVLHMYLIRPGIWALIDTGVIYTVCTNFSYKQRWVRTKWIVTFATFMMWNRLSASDLPELCRMI